MGGEKTHIIYARGERLPPLVEDESKRHLPIHRTFPLGMLRKKKIKVRTKGHFQIHIYIYFFYLQLLLLIRNTQKWGWLTSSGRRDVSHCPLTWRSWHAVLRWPGLASPHQCHAHALQQGHCCFPSGKPRRVKSHYRWLSFSLVIQNLSLFPTRAIKFLITHVRR